MMLMNTRRDMAGCQHEVVLKISFDQKGRERVSSVCELTASSHIQTPEYLLHLHLTPHATNNNNTHALGKTARTHTVKPKDYTK